MDYVEIVEIIIKTVCLILGLLLIVLYPRVMAWLNTRVTVIQVEQITNYIKRFVEAAEQTLKDEDPTGEKRKQYVTDQLRDVGIQISEQVNAIIESEVFRLKSKQD